MLNIPDQINHLKQLSFLKLPTDQINCLDFCMSLMNMNPSREKTLLMVTLVLQLM